MDKKTKNHVILCGFTQYPKSNPITTNLDVSKKLCKTMFTSIIGISLPNIDGELKSSSSKKHGTISMRMMIDPNATINSQVSMVNTQI
jgi:hypothetical protein